MSNIGEEGYRTRQGFAKTVPQNDATALRLALTCTDCGTLRVFQINRAMTMLQEREIAHIEVTTGCEMCRHGVKMTLFWDMEGASYAYTKLPIGDAIGVEDDLGLRRPAQDDHEQHP